MVATRNVYLKMKTLEEARKILGFELDTKEYGDLHAYYVEEWEAK